jgi:hypothetical protein
VSKVEETVENQHRMIPGYRDLTEGEIQLIAEIKAAEENLTAVWGAVKRQCPGLDPRDYAMARTHFEDGFIRLVRSVAKPDSPWVQEATQQAAEGRR